MRAQQQDRQRTGREDGETSVIIAPEGKGRDRKDEQMSMVRQCLRGMTASSHIGMLRSLDYVHKTCTKSSQRKFLYKWEKFIKSYSLPSSGCWGRESEGYP